MIAAIEILRIGPDNALFQICDGRLFGQVHFGEDAPLPFSRRARLEQPEVVSFLHDWLARDGALIGSQQPPRLSWQAVEDAVPAARRP